MIWHYILAGSSATLFTAFVILCVAKFGLLSCYSAYGPRFQKPSSFNLWTVVTGLTAVLLMPVMLDCSAGSAWQFTGFLCTVLLVFVALTPDYATIPLAEKVHLICAIGSAIWAIAYIFCVAPSFWWVPVAWVTLATIASFVTGFRQYWDFWYEMAAFYSIFTTAFILI